MESWEHQFSVSGFNKSVSVRADCADVESLFQFELGGFFEVATSDRMNRQLLGEVRVYTSEDAYVRARKLTQNVEFSEFMMHAPVNTPRERRHGRIGLLGEDSIICDSTTKKSIIIARQADHVVNIYGASRKEAAKEARRIVRDQLLVRAAEASGSIVVHSACVALKDGTGILIVGPSGSGKTSFFLHALAHPDEFTGLTCERTVLSSVHKSVAARGLPEKINLFPGSLRSFSHSSHLADGIPDGQLWARSHKRKIDWRELFRLFGAEVPEGEVELAAVIVPHFGSSSLVSPISREKCRALLASEVLTFSDDIRPNWLSWYHPNFAGTRVMFERLLNLPAFQVEWRAEDNLAGQITAVLDKVLSARHVPS